MTDIEKEKKGEKGEEFAVVHANLNEAAAHIQPVVRDVHCLNSPRHRWAKPALDGASRARPRDGAVARELGRPAAFLFCTSRASARAILHDPRALVALGNHAVAVDGTPGVARLQRLIASAVDEPVDSLEAAAEAVATPVSALVVGKRFFGNAAACADANPETLAARGVAATQSGDAAKACIAFLQAAAAVDRTSDAGLVAALDEPRAAFTRACREYMLSSTARRPRVRTLILDTHAAPRRDWPTALIIPPAPGSLIQRRHPAHGGPPFPYACRICQPHSAHSTQLPATHRRTDRGCARQAGRG